MSNLFHVNPDSGDVRPCGAKKGKCPFGQEFHGANREECEQAFENQIAKETPKGMFGFMKKDKLKGTAEAIVKNFALAVDDLYANLNGGEVVGVKVTPEEQAAFYHYTAGYDLNKPWTGDSNPNLAKDPLNHELVLAHSRKLIDGVFARMPNKNSRRTSFQGVQSREFNGKFEQDFLAKLVPGKTLKMNGYASSAPEQAEAEALSDEKGAVLELRGKGGLLLQGASPAMVYNHGTEWKVLSVKKDGALTRAVLEMV